ncbi:MAG: aminodeoxychorismate/anthranilate synthase component II [Vampirovibrionales bacterium]
MLLLLDHLDSFTHNLAQGLQIGLHQLAGPHHDIPVWIANAHHTSLNQIKASCLTGVILSPGPGRADNPQDTGLSPTLLSHLAQHCPTLPVLGVCLGMQLMAYHAGGQLALAPTLMHGKTSTITITHPTSWLLASLPNPFMAMRYHSWCIQTLPACYYGTAYADSDTTLMAMEHTTLPWAGVQFHPESIASPQGQLLLNTFVAHCLQRMPNPV